jgi:hypothetical protein
MIKAFKKIKTLRETNGLSEVNQVIQSISKIFTANSKGELPKVQGGVGRSFHPKTKEKLKIDDWNAEISAGDSIHLRIGLEKTKNKTTILAYEQLSHRGIRFYGKQHFPRLPQLTSIRPELAANFWPLFKNRHCPYKTFVLTRPPPCKTMFVWTLFKSTNIRTFHGSKTWHSKK